MNDNVLEPKINSKKTADFKETDENLLNSGINNNTRVDINVLKARVQAAQDIENKRNVFIFIFFLIILGMIGIYFSL